MTTAQQWCWGCCNITRVRGIVCRECASNRENLIPSSARAEINGACLHNLRLRRFWTQADLAYIWNTSPQNVSHYEREVRRPLVWYLRLLCEATGHSLDDMLGILQVTAIWPTPHARLSITRPV